uniref:Uncharacterized protein n=1 Tax=Arundo donax TaxID=35708 RepID=A0A0A9GCH6_ARUDO
MLSKTNATACLNVAAAVLRTLSEDRLLSSR